MMEIKTNFKGFRPRKYFQIERTQIARKSFKYIRSILAEQIRFRRYGAQGTKETVYLYGEI